MRNLTRELLNKVNKTNFNYVIEDKRKEMKVIKGLKQNSIGLVVWIFLSFFLIKFLIGNVGEIPVLKRLFLAVAAIVFVLPTHELLHAFVMMVFSKEKVTIQPAKMPSGFWGIKTSQQGHLKSWQALIMYLFPFLLLTIIPVFMMVILKKVHFFPFIVAIGNCAGAYFDLLDTILLFEKKQ